MSLPINVKESIIVKCTPQELWDFTQDFQNRLNWDKSIYSVDILENEPNSKVRIKALGNLTTTLQYKLDEKPHKTSLIVVGTNSFFIEVGGGTWNYKTIPEGTLWTQSNSLVLRKSILFRIIRTLISFQLRLSRLKAMKLAK